MATQTLVVAILGGVGTVVSGAVGVLGPVLAGRREDRRQRRAFEQDLVKADREKVRGILSDAAYGLYEADGKYDTAWQDFFHKWRLMDEESREAINALMLHVQKLALLEYQLLILLPARDPLSESFSRALLGLREAGRQLKLAFMSREDAGIEKWHEFDGEMSKGYTEFREGRRAFLDAAPARTGLRLELPPDGRQGLLARGRARLARRSKVE